MGHIFRAEMKKVFRKYTMWFFLLLLFVGYIFYVVGEIYGKTGNEQYSYQAYRQLTDTVDTECLPEEIERLEKQAENFSDTELYTKDLSAENALYEEVLKQMRHVAEYTEYVDGIVENAQKGGISLFQKNTYTRREQEKTVQDFEKLRSCSVAFAPYKGVYLLAGLDLGDAVIVIFIVLLTASLITTERENRTLDLLHSTCHGRKRDGAVKFWCGVCMLLAGVFCIFVCKSSLILATYGIGDWNCSIQSVYSYGSCRYSLSVGSFLILVAIGRITAYLALYSILFFLAIYIKKAVFLYFSCGIFMGLEGLFYVAIPEYSWLSMLRKMNVIPFLSSDVVLGEYQNISLFQRPVDYAYVVFVVELCIILVFMILGICSFERCMEQRAISFFRIWRRRGFCKAVKADSVNMPLSHSEAGAKKRSGSWRFPKAVFLFGMELKKVWIGEKAFLLFIIGCVFLFFLYSPLEESFANKDEVYYCNYMLKIQGKYSEEKLAYLYQEREELEKIQEELDSGIKYTAAQRELLLQKTEQLTGLGMAIQNAEYVKENGLSYFVYDKGYLIMLGNYEGKWELLKLRLIVLLIIIGFAAFVWGIEAWSGMDKVLQISAEGERSLRWYKRCHILLLSLLIFAVAYVPWIWNVMHVYDCSHWAAPLGSIMVFQDLWFREIPIGAAMLVFWLLHLLYLYFVGMIVCLIRKRMGNYILTALVAFVLFAIPVFVLGNIGVV